MFGVNVDTKAGKVWCFLFFSRIRGGRERRKRMGVVGELTGNFDRHFCVFYLLADKFSNLEGKIISLT